METRFEDGFPYEVTWTGPKKHAKKNAEVDCWTHLWGAEYKHDFDKCKLQYLESETKGNTEKVFFRLV